MHAYIIRRILQMIPVLLLILIMTFLLFELSPGDASGNFIAPRMGAADRAAIAERFGLDEPVHVRFVSWMGAALQGDFGRSFQYRRPALEVIRDMVGPTLALSTLALILSMVVGIPAGIISATRQYSVADNTLTVFSLLGLSMPVFFFALILLRIFSVELGLFPMFGLADHAYRPANNFAWLIHRLWHLTLPTIVLGLGGTATFMRYVRTSMLEVIKSDYIRTARAKGVKEKVVIYRHAFRNAMIPVVTLLGFWIPSLIGGAVITESIFGLPGMGRLLVDATFFRDMPIVIAGTVMIAALTLVSMLIADIAYAVVDPRVKYE